MKHANYTRDGPRTLVQRLAHLTGTLEALRDQVKEAIARAVSSAVADAVHDALAGLLNRKARPPNRERLTGLFQEDDRWAGEQDDPWEREEWNSHEDDVAPSPRETSSRGRIAVVTALQAGLWWLRKQPTTRPLLTTALVTLAAGVVAFFAGSTVTATATVIGAAASVLSTSEVARSTTSWLSDLVRQLARSPSSP